MSKRSNHWTLLIVLLLTALAWSAGQTFGREVEGSIIEADLSRLQTLMAGDELSARELAEIYLARIERLNGELNAIIAVCPDVREQAAARDAERAAGTVRGPLHGIPVILKDNIESREEVATTAGSLALAGNVTRRDAFLVSRLREAGAVILGKANLSEWANFRSERSSSGWSGVGGQTANPYDPSRSPCGSSSGSAVAVAANLCALAVGTETNGSVVCPASSNGVVGIKPTLGLVSRAGIVPLAHSQDTAGPMGRTVADAVALLAAMIGEDPADPATGIAAEAAGWDLSAHLRADGLAGKRIGILRSLTGYHSEVDRLFDAAIDDLRSAGAVIVDSLSFPPVEGLGQASYDLLLYEFKHDIDAYLGSLPNPDLARLTLADLIVYNDDNAERELPWFGQEIFLAAQEKGPLTDQAYLDALELVKRVSGPEGIDQLVAEHELDALIAPTGSPAWKIDLVDGDHFMGASSSYPARAGTPNITVPMGEVHGLPVGLSILGPALAEPVLIEIAYAYEQKTGHRFAPKF